MMVSGTELKRNDFDLTENVRRSNCRANCVHTHRLFTRTIKDFSNATDLCIQEAESRICWFRCTRSLLSQPGCSLGCIGIGWFLRTLGDLRNSTSSCHWSLGRVCHMFGLRSQRNTSHETHDESLFAPSLLAKCLIHETRSRCCIEPRPRFRNVF